MVRCKNVLSLVPPLLFLSLPGPTKAASLALQSTPEISVFVYGFPGLSSWTVESAESAAADLLRPVGIRLKWLNCSFKAAPARCYLPPHSSDLAIRFSRAVPSDDGRALGMAVPSQHAAIAFVFYDRVVALQTRTNVLHAMLGRVLAHEITHLLLPREKHSALGLMRGDWAPDDLIFANPVCLRLTANSIQLLHREALRRTQATNMQKAGGF